LSKVYTVKDAKSVIKIVSDISTLISLIEGKMTKPTTIRLPEDLLSDINQFVRETKLDRSAYLREILQKGFSLDKQERLLQKYANGELSQMEVCQALKWDPWQFLTQLKAKNLHLNVGLEDFLDSSKLPRHP
jgi:hypothetical protein